MLFDHRSAQRHSGHIALPAVCMVRKAHGQAKLLAQGDHGGQVGILVRGGILCVAVQKRDIRAAVILQNAHGILHLAKGAHAGGKDHRCACFAHGLQIRQIGDLAAGHFDGRQMQASQKFYAGNIKRRRKIGNADGIAIFLELFVGGKIKMQPAHHFQLAFGTAGGFFLIFCLFGKLADHQFGHGRLVFHHIRAAFLGLQRHLLGHFQAAVMVYACFGNDDGMQKNSSCLRVWPCRGRAIRCLFLL